MRAGLLRDMIDIEAPTESRDSYGAVSATWASIAGNIPATVTPLRGVEGQGNSETESSMSHKVTIRYSATVSGVTTKHRVKFGSRYFDVQSVINVQERNRMIELMCVEHGI